MLYLLPKEVWGEMQQIQAASKKVRVGHGAGISIKDKQHMPLKDTAENMKRQRSPDTHENAKKKVTRGGGGGKGRIAERGGEGGEGAEGAEGGEGEIGEGSRDLQKPAP